ncbi:hypothetical protein GW916_10375 [bacterium]|nr:hypothetical protein [bacterium]
MLKLLNLLPVLGKCLVLSLALALQVSCSSSTYSGDPVILRFVAEEDLGLVIFPVDWFRSASRSNPGVDCTLKLVKQGPPQNIYSCVVKDAKNVYIVKVFETFKGEYGDRHVSKLSLDSKWAVTRDHWIEALRAAGFWESSRNPLGAVGQQWGFVSPDETSVVTIFWNEKTQAVSAWVKPFADPVESEVKPTYEN